MRVKLRDTRRARNWKLRASVRLRRWKREIFKPLTYIEEEAQKDIELLETIADIEYATSPPDPAENYELEQDASGYLEIDKEPIFKRLEERTPILIYTSGRRLERLTR